MSQDKKSEVSPEGNSMYAGIFPEISTPDGIPDQMKSAVQTAEKELKDLRSKIEEQYNKSTTSEERAKYSAILKKLDSHYSDIASKTKEGTKGSLGSLRDFMETLPSDQKTLVERAKQGISESAQKAQNALKNLPGQAETALGTTGGELVSDAKKAAEAAATGDLSKAKELAEGITERVTEAGEKIREYTGSEAFKKIFEPISENGIFGIFAVLGNLFKFFTNGFKFSEILGGASIPGASGGEKPAPSKAEQQVTAAQDALGSFEKMSEKDKEELLTKMAAGIADDISTRYLGGANLSPEKLQKLKDIIKSTNLNPDDLQKLAKKVNEGQKVTVENIAELLNISIVGSTELMWKIAFSGVVPLGKIIYEGIERGSKTAVGLTFAGLGLPPMVMSVEELNAFIAKHGSEGGEKEMALIQMQMYRPLGIFWAISSGILANVAQGIIAVGVDTASGANGFKVAEGLAGIRGKNYMTVFEEFEKINSQFKAFPNTGQHADTTKLLIEEMKTSIGTVTKNWKIIAILEEVGYDYSKLATHKDIASVLDSGEIAKIKTAQNPQLALRDIVKSPNTRGEFKNIFSQFFGTTEGVAYKYLNNIDEVQRFQNLIVSSDRTGLERLNALGKYTSSLKLIRSADVVSLHLENADDVANFQGLRKLLATAPELLRGLGAILPAGAFVVTMSSAVSNDANSSEILDSLQAVLIPMVGGWQLVKNFGVSFDDLKKGKMPTLADAGTAALGATIMTFEGARILGGAGQAAGMFKVGKFADGAKILGKTAFMHPIDIARSVGYISRGAMHASKAAAPIYSEVAKNLLKMGQKIPKKGWVGIAGGVLLAGGAAAAVLSGKDDAEIQADLQKNGILDKKGELTAKFYSEFSKKGNDEKTRILTDLFGALVDVNEKRPRIHFSAEHSEFAIVVKKTEERTAWQEILNSDTLFRDKLQKMGIDVVVVVEEELPKKDMSEEKKVPKL